MSRSEKVVNSLTEVRKEDLNKKIDGMWRESNGNNNGSKKLTVKLENFGPIRQKLLLKLECNTRNIREKSYNIISDLLKDFFSNGTQ